MAEHPDGVHAIGAEPQGPQQARRRDLAEHFAVVLAELDLHRVVVPDVAPEFRGVPLEDLFLEVATNCLHELERARSTWTSLDVLFFDNRRHPDFGASDRVSAI